MTTTTMAGSRPPDPYPNMTWVEDDTDDGIVRVGIADLVNEFIALWIEPDTGDPFQVVVSRAAGDALGKALTKRMERDGSEAVTFSAGYWQYLRENRYEFDLDREMFDHERAGYDTGDQHEAVDALFDAFSEAMASTAHTFVVPTALADLLNRIRADDEADQHERRFGPW